MPRILSDRDLAIIRNRQGENIPVPPARKPRKNDESRIQMALVRWWAIEHTSQGIPENLLFSIPNGGWRDQIGAAILKKEGQRNGVSDMMLAVPRNGLHGLFLELKHETGKLRPEQKEFLSEVAAYGYAAEAVYGYDAATKTIRSYLAGLL